MNAARRLLPSLASLVIIASASAVGIGCSSEGGASTDPGTVSETPAAVVTSEAGGFSVSVHSAPDAAPSRGNNTLRLDVTRVSDGKPAEGLTFDVVPWMPAMGHGTSVKPTVAPGATPGTYDVTNVNLFMPGLWEIRTTISGSVSDHVAPQFDIK